MTSSHRHRHRRHHRRHRKERRDDTSSPNSTSITNSIIQVDKTTVSDCPSPPSYSVVEGADGRLVNPALNVTWPERPTAGRHSMLEYLKRRNKVGPQKQRSIRDTQEETNNAVTDKDDNGPKSSQRSYSRKKEPDECCEIDEFTERSQRIDFVEAQARQRKAYRKEEKRREKERRKSAKAGWLSLEELARQAAAHHCHIGEGTSCSQHVRHAPTPNPVFTISSGSTLSSTAVASKSERGTSLLVPQSLSSHFIGVMPESKVQRFLRPTQFVLYYHRAQIQFLDDIPLDLPLRMAYMTNRGTVHHFTLDVENRINNRRVWQVILDEGGDSAKKQPGFLSLSSLVSFYEAFVSLKSNGEVEVFPIAESAE
uniref:UBX domain-containing protein n=1 Tax=Panagrellus redivivus TaxID=6233 RepID=A0A7E4V2P4_PANRE